MNQDLFNNAGIKESPRQKKPFRAGVWPVAILAVLAVSFAGVLLAREYVRTVVFEEARQWQIAGDQMQTATLRPNAAGDVTQLSVSGATANWDAVNEDPSDGDSSYVHNNTKNTTQYDLYGLADADPAGDISNVTVWINARQIAKSGSTAATVIKTESTEYRGTANALSSSSWTTYSTSYLNNPQTGVAWTWNQINALQAGVEIYNPNTAGIDAGATQVWVEVEYSAPELVQSAYRWRNDDGSESGATWKEGENTALSNASTTEIIRLRMEIEETNSLPETVNAQLEFSSDADGCTGGNWTVLATNTTSWIIATSSHITNGTSTTDQLTSSVKTFTAGRIFDSQNQDTTGVELNNTHTEWEWTIRGDGAAYGTTYYFRVTDAGSPFDSYTNCAQLTTVVPPIDIIQRSYIFENDDGSNVNSNTLQTSSSSTPITNVKKGERLTVRFHLDDVTGLTATSLDIGLLYDKNDGAWREVKTDMVSDGDRGEIVIVPGRAGQTGDALTSTRADATDGGTDCDYSSLHANGIWIDTELGRHPGIGDDTCTEVSFVIDTSQANPGQTYRFAVRIRDPSIDLWQDPVQIDNYPTITIEGNTTKRYSKDNMPFFPNCTNTDWGCMTVDSTANTGTFWISTTRDAKGDIWISYRDETGGNLKVARYVGSGGTGCGTHTGADAWECVTVDSTANVGSNSTIVSDFYGNIWMSYRDATNDALKVATNHNHPAMDACSASGWWCTTITHPDDISGYEGSIAIDNDGNPWFTHDMAPAREVEIVRYVGSGGSCENDAFECMRPQANDGSWMSSIAFAPDGNPWVSYYRNESDLTVLRYVGSGGDCPDDDRWNCMQVHGASQDFGITASLAFDHEGRANVVFYSRQTSEIFWATYVGSGGSGCDGSASSQWNCELIESGIGVWPDMTLGFDASGIPWIGYWQPTGSTTRALGAITYAGSGGSCANSAWDCITVDATASNIGEYMSDRGIAFDLSGSPWMAYRDNTNSRLKVAKLHLPSTPLSPEAKVPYAINQSASSGDARYRLDAGLTGRSNTETCGAQADKKGYCGVSAENSDYDSITAIANQRPLKAFATRFSDNVKTPSITWIGQSTVAPSVNALNLEVYRFGTTNAWETLDTNSICSANSDCTLSGTPSGTASEYFEQDGANYWFYARLWQEEDSASSQTLKTNFFEADVRITISGTVYTDEGNTTSTESSIVHLAANGTILATTTVSGGEYEFIVDINAISSGHPITVFLESGTESGAAVTIFGSGDILDLDIYLDRIILRHEGSGPVRNEDIGHFDSGNNANVPYSVSAGPGFAITADDGHKILVPSGNTYRPEGNVITPALSAYGTFELETYSLILTSSGESSDCSGSVGTVMPFCIAGGTFSSATSTVSFEGTATTTIPALTYYNLQTNPATGSPEYILGPLSADYFTDFSEYDSNTAPNDWTRRWVTTGDGWLVRNLAEASGGKVLEFQNQETGARRALSWDLIDADSDREDVEILMKFRGFFDESSNNQSNPQTLIRGSGIASEETGYAHGYRWNLDDLRLNKYVGGTFTIISDYSITRDLGTWHWTRIRVNGTSHKARVWEDGEKEPSEWTVEDTDASISDAGWVGLFSFGYREYEIDQFGVNTGGGTVPLNALFVENDFVMVNGGGSVSMDTHTYDIDIAIEGSFSIGENQSFTASQTADLNVRGSWANSGTFTHNSGKVTLSSDSAATITAGGSNFFDLLLDNNSGEWSLQDNMEVEGVFDVNQGTFNAGSNTVTLSGSGTPFIARGTFSPATSTVSFEGTTTTTIPAATYYNLQTNPPTGSPEYFLGGSGSTTQFFVQSGEATMLPGSSTALVTLGTPVLENQSFVIASVRSDNYRPSQTLVSAKLNVSDGYATELSLQRSFNADTTIVVSWQVITSEDFTVQSGEVNMSEQVSSTVAISEVDLGKAFIVITGRTSWVSARGGFIKGEFIDSSNIKLSRTFTDAPGDDTVRWYVVEWEGASVQRGITTLSGISASETINEINLSNTFLLFSYNSTGFTTPSSVFTQGFLESNSSVKFEKYSSTYTSDISWFIISHPGISVQYGTDDATGLSFSNSLNPAIDTSQSFAATPLMGNAKNPLNDSLFLHSSYNTHSIVNSETITVERSNDTDTLTASWFVVSSIPPLTVENNFTLLENASTTIRADASDSDISIGNDLIIGSGQAFAASQTADLNVGGNWTNSGTFNHSSGTVRFADNTKTSAISGTTTFYNLVSEEAGKTLRFAAGVIQEFAGSFTVAGGDGNPANILSDTSGVQWLPNFLSPQGTHESPTVSYAYIQDSGCHEGPPSSESIFLDWTSEEGSNVDTSCWIWPDVTISGTVYTDEGNTTSTESSIVHLAANGTILATTTVSGGEYEFIVDSGTISPGHPITVFLESGTESGAAVTIFGSGDILDLDIYLDRIILRHEGSGPVRNEDIGHFDSGNNANVPYSVSAGPGFAITADDGHKILVPSGNTYRPEGNVITPALSAYGTFELETYSLILTGSGESSDCSGSVGTVMPFCIAGGTFSSATSTVSFEGTATTTIPALTYYNLQTNPATGSPEYVLESAETFVQSGKTVMLSGTNIETITLDTPVKEGQSFVIASVNSNNYRPSRTFITAELRTVVGGYFTELRLERSFNADTTVTISWQVITGDDFTVQTGEVDISGRTETDVTINEVDLTKSFVITNTRTSWTGAGASFIKASLPSSTNLRLETTGAPTNALARWYVVEWEGARVQSGETTLSGSFSNIPIDQINSANSFLLFSYKTTAGTIPARVFTNGLFISDTDIRFQRHSSADTNYISWFVISHPGISTQSGSDKTSGLSFTNSLSPAIDTSRSFAVTPLMGNAKNPHTETLSLHFAFNTHTIIASNNITVERGTATSTLTGSWFTASLFDLAIGNNFTIANGGGNATVRADTNNVNVAIGNDLTIELGQSLIASQTADLNVRGNWTNNGTFTHNSGKVTLSSDSAATITTGGSNFFDLLLDNNSGEWSLQDNMEVEGVFDINQGTFNAGSNTVTLSGSGTPFIARGTFSPATSTVSFEGTATTTIPAVTYYNLQTNPPTGSPEYSLRSYEKWFWRYRNSTDHRTTVTNSAGTSNDATWYAAMRVYLPSGTANSIAFYPNSTDASFRGHLHENDSINNIPGTQIGETALLETGSFTAKDWNETSLLVPVEIDEGYYWIVMEVHEKEVDPYPISTIDPYYEYAGHFSLDGGLTWQTLIDSGIDQSWTFEILIDPDLIVANDFSMSGNGNASVNADAHDPQISVKGNFTIGSGQAFAASDTSELRLEGNFENNESFIHNNGVVRFENGSASSSIFGAITFYNLVSSAPSKSLTFESGTAATTTVMGSLVLEGGGCETPIYLASDSPGTQWYISVDSEATTTLNYLNASDSNASGGKTLIATNSVEGSPESNTNWDIDNGECEPVVITTIVVSGTVFQDEGNTTSTAESAIHLAINGSSVATTTASSTTGFYSFDVDESLLATSTPVTVFIDGGSESGAAVTLYGGSGDLTGFDIYDNRIILRHEESGPVRNENIGHFDSGNNANVPYSVSAGPGFAITADDGHKILVPSGNTYRLEGNVITPALSAYGTFELETYSLILTGSGESSDCSGSVGTVMPFCIAGGTFSSATSTVSFEGTATTTIATSTYYNLQSNPATGTPAYIFQSGILSINNNFTATTTDNALVFINANVNDPEITIGGNFAIGADQTFESSNTSDFKVGGNWTNNGTFTHNNGTVTFNATTTGKTIADGGSPFYNIVFNGIGGGWLYRNGAETAPNSTLLENGEATFLNTKTGNVTVNGGVLNVDWYLGIHIVAADDTNFNIETGANDITVSENSGTPAATVFRHDGNDWGTASSTQTTGSGSSGINPQPDSAGAIRIREYRRTDSATTTYNYNLQISAQGGFREYDYYADHGENYLTSSLEAGGDNVISVNWYRTTPGSVNGEKDYSGLNQPPAEGTWYAGVESDFEFSVDSLSMDMGSLDPFNTWTATGTTILSATTSFPGGYTVNAYASNNGELRLDESNVIIRWPYDNSSPSLWEGTCDENSQCGFGHTTDDLLGADCDDNRFGGGTKYAGFATSSVSTVEVAKSCSAQASGKDTAITYRVSANRLTLPGVYGITIHYIASVNY